MIIADTTRNIQKCIEYKNNFNYAIQVAELEPLIDGAIIDNSYFDLEQNEKLFCEFVMNQTGFSKEEYLKIFNPLKRISGFDFMMNPYLKNISLKDFTSDDIILEKSFYRQNEFVIFDEPIQSNELIRKYTVGVFDCDVYSYVLKNKDFVWMSINPMEINTSRQAIENAHGNVLVLGGGLGYYPYMISLKDNVSSVTIIESNKTIKNILECVILPQFPNKKVKVILDDAYEYLKNGYGSNYDCIFIDIWQDNVKGAEDYRKFVKFEEKYPDIKFDYWLENSILDSTIVNIYQYFSAKLGTNEYQKFFSIIAPELYNYLESKQDKINRPEQMKYFLTRNYAKEVLKNM